MTATPTTDRISDATAAKNPPAPVNGRKVGFVHLGCPKNLVDTETMLGLLEGDGHTIVADESEADVVMVNTCAFIDKAQEESVKTLATLAEQGKKLLITGCLAQKFQGELLTLFPEAEAVVGIDAVPDIATIVRKTTQGERVLAVQQDRDYLLKEDTVRRHITMGGYTYVKIAEGCDYKCSFCIIPTMRGAFRSRSLENLVENVTELVDKGVSEIILVGQDTTSYGKDLPRVNGKTQGLPQLLQALNEIRGLDWIRVMYAYPNLVSDELLETYDGCDKVVKYLDCPLQHSHPEILQRMRRPVLDHVAFAERVRARVRNVRLRTAFIVGFPGETQAHFEHLKNTIETVGFERMGVFEYSDVDTAHSTSLDGKVAKATIKARRNELMALQQPIAFAHNQALVGQTLPVMIDQSTPYGQWVGRTQWDAPEIDNTVLVKGPAIPGQIVPVTITQATPYDLKGVVAEIDG